MRPLVILRPEPAASATAERARALGLDAKAIPLFDIAAIDWTAPDPDEFDALVLTSANAIRHGGPQLAALKRLPVHAVGEATAVAARAAGFEVASTGKGGVEDLALPAGRRLLHLAGRTHRPAGAAMAIPVYEARPVAVPAGLDELAGCVVAVHSPVAGRRLAELVRERAGIAVAAISVAAAEACGEGWERLEAAAVPNDAALLALAARLCETGD